MIRTCDQCGKDGYIKPSRADQDTFFCSTQCKKDWSTLEKRLLTSYEVDEYTGCWEYVGGLRAGYGAINDGGKTYGAHRVSYELHKGHIPDGLFVCHTCDNRKCINPDHLWLGTNKDNMQDALAKGRMVIPNNVIGEFKDGHIPYNAVLTDDEVCNVRRMLDDGIRVTEISEITGMSRYKINDIRRGKSYKHVL